MPTGRFIDVEGLDGAGKGSALTRIHQVLDSLGVPYKTTREPGGTPYGELIRNILKGEVVGIGPEVQTLDPITELLLFCAQRREHIKHFILPTLAKGDWVISDRHNLTMLAYQGAGRQIPMRITKLLDRITVGDFNPDVTFYLDVDVDVAMRRQGVRDDGYRDTIESGGREFFTRAAEGYRRALEDPKVRRGKVIIIDANQDEADMLRDVEKEMTNYLKSCLKKNSSFMLF